MTGATTNPWVESLDPDQLQAALDRLRRNAGDHEPIATQAMQYARGDEHFALYLAMCARKCQRAIGVTIWDLADCLWRDWYDDGLPPREAVLECIERDDTFSVLFASMYGGE